MTSKQASAKPSYDQTQAAYQRAFRRELGQIVLALPLTKEMRVLDAPCGNGFYSRFLAQRLRRDDKIDCVDLCHAYLSSVRKKLGTASCAWATHKADVCQLPFAAGTFDRVWCAQSLISLPDPLSALRDMRRVLGTGGILAILENDIFHHVLLPWPVDLEVPVQRAIQLASRDRYGSSTKLAPARRLSQLFAQAGFESCTKRTFAADRQAPWHPHVRQFLEFHVKDLRTLIRHQLSPKVRRRFDRYMNPRNPNSLFADKAMDLTCLNVLYQGKK